MLPLCTRIATVSALVTISASSCGLPDRESAPPTLTQHEKTRVYLNVIGKAPPPCIDPQDGIAGPAPDGCVDAIATSWRDFLPPLAGKPSWTPVGIASSQSGIGRQQSALCGTGLCAATIVGLLSTPEGATLVAGVVAITTGWFIVQNTPEPGTTYASAGSYDELDIRVPSNWSGRVPTAPAAPSGHEAIEGADGILERVADHLERRDDIDTPDEREEATLDETSAAGAAPSLAYNEAVPDLGRGIDAKLANTKLSELSHAAYDDVTCEEVKVALYASCLLDAPYGLASGQSMKKRQHIHVCVDKRGKVWPSTYYFGAYPDQRVIFVNAADSKQGVRIERLAFGKATQDYYLYPGGNTLLNRSADFSEHTRDTLRNALTRDGLLSLANDSGLPMWGLAGIMFGRSPGHPGFTRYLLTGDSGKRARVYAIKRRSYGR